MMEAERDAEDLLTVAPKSLRAHLTRMRQLHDESKRIMAWLAAIDKASGDDQTRDADTCNLTRAESYRAEAEAWVARGYADR